MANADKPFGLRPVRTINGASWNGASNPYKLASAYNTDISRGDPVKLVANGVIERAAAGETAVGVFLSVEYVASDGSQQFLQKWTGSTATLGSVAATAQVADDPWLIFEMQQDSDSATPAQTDIGACFDWIFTHSGTASGSKAEIDTSSLTVGMAGLKVLRYVDRPDNAIGAYAVAEVLINEHILKAAAGI